MSYGASCLSVGAIWLKSATLPESAKLSILYIVCCILCIILCQPDASNSAKCDDLVCCVLCIVYVWSAIVLYIVDCAVYCVRCIVYIVHCILCAV